MKTLLLPAFLAVLVTPAFGAPVPTPDPVADDGSARVSITDWPGPPAVVNVTVTPDVPDVTNVVNVETPPPSVNVTVPVPSVDVDVAPAAVDVTVPVPNVSVSVSATQQAPDTFAKLFDWYTTSGATPVPETYVVPAGKTLYVTEVVTGEIRHLTYVSMAGAVIVVIDSWGSTEHELATPIRVAAGQSIVVGPYDSPRGCPCPGPDSMGQVTLLGYFV